MVTIADAPTSGHKHTAKPRPARPRMASFALDVPSPHPPGRAWAALWDLRAHTALIPLTTVKGTTGAGGRFVARTALGPWGFEDPMEVVRWCPPAPAEDASASGAAGPAGCRAIPGHAVIVKRGRVIRGRIEVRITPDEGIGSRIRWAQEISVAALPALADPLVAAVARLAYGAVLRRLVA